MPLHDTCDLAIVGGGPGGYVAAIRAAQLGLKVILIEKAHLGGVCLNWGCIPTKALLRNGEVIDLVRRGKESGFALAGFQADYGAAVERSRKAAERLVKGMAGLMRNNDISIVEGMGRIVGQGALRVASQNGGQRELRSCPRTTSKLCPLKASTKCEAVSGQSPSAGAIIAATGARARTIPGVKIDGERILTARHALAMRRLPESVIIVEAGPIGMEFAYLWHTYGSKVTILETLPHLLPLEDEEISQEMERAYQRRKIQFQTSTQVEGVEPSADAVRVRVRSEEGRAEHLEAEKVLVAIGVQPNSEDLGLEASGVRTERGWIAVDHRMRTTAPDIWAVGDVTGKLPLAHVASAQGILAAEDIAGIQTGPLDYGAMPRCTYTQPQVASFGLTEAQALEQGHTIRVSRFPFRANGKALALGDHDDFAKLVVDERSGWLLGAHLVGPEVTELLPELLLARTAELLPEQVARSVHAHPTLSETLMEAAHGVFDKPIHV
jgi:dihydrolipoamide dehydrogenase